jgi:hypothetical protein
MTFKHRPQFKLAAAAALTAAALAAPAAQSRPIIDRDPPVRSAVPDTPTLQTPPSRASAPVVRSIDTGFDWSSAAIGAGSASALILLVSLGGFARTSRRDIRVAS